MARKARPKPKVASNEDVDRSIKRISRDHGDLMRGLAGGQAKAATPRRRSVKTPDMFEANATKFGRPSSLEGRLRDLAAAVGGIEKLALAVGVNVRAVQRWNTGEMKPRKSVRILLAQLCITHGLKQPFPIEP